MSLVTPAPPPAILPVICALRNPANASADSGSSLCSFWVPWRARAAWRRLRAAQGCTAVQETCAPVMYCCALHQVTACSVCYFCNSSRCDCSPACLSMLISGGQLQNRSCATVRENHPVGQCPYAGLQMIQSKALASPICVEPRRKGAHTGVMATFRPNGVRWFPSYAYKPTTWVLATSLTVYLCSILASSGQSRHCLFCTSGATPGDQPPSKITFQTVTASMHEQSHDCRLEKIHTEPEAMYASGHTTLLPPVLQCHMHVAKAPASFGSDPCDMALEQA